MILKEELTDDPAQRMVLQTLNWIRELVYMRMICEQTMRQFDLN